MASSLISDLADECMRVLQAAGCSDLGCDPLFGCTGTFRAPDRRELAVAFRCVDVSEPAYPTGTLLCAEFDVEADDDRAMTEIPPTRRSAPMRFESAPEAIAEAAALLMSVLADWTAADEDSALSGLVRSRLASW